MPSMMHLVWSLISATISSRLTPLLDPPTHLQHAVLLQEPIQSLGHDDGGEAGPELLHGGKHAVERLKRPGLWGARCKGLPVDRVAHGVWGMVARVLACSSTWESVARQIALQSDRTLLKNGAR